jgi:Uma2 family endonuclease
LGVSSFLSRFPRTKIEMLFPDLVLEVALTSSGLDKLKIYAQFEIPEIWIWRRNRLEVFVLKSARKYAKSPRSKVLPSLNIAVLERRARNKCPENCQSPL